MVRKGHYHWYDIMVHSTQEGRPKPKWRDRRWCIDDITRIWLIIKITIIITIITSMVTSVVKAPHRFEISDAVKWTHLLKRLSNSGEAWSLIYYQCLSYSLMIISISAPGPIWSGWNICNYFKHKNWRKSKNREFNIYEYWAVLGSFEEIGGEILPEKALWSQGSITWLVFYQIYYLY